MADPKSFKYVPIFTLRDAKLLLCWPFERKLKGYYSNNNVMVFRLFYCYLFYYCVYVFCVKMLLYCNYKKQYFSVGNKKIYFYYPHLYLYIYVVNTVQTPEMDLKCVQLA